MALLKNTTVSGSLRATDTVAAQTAQFKILKIPDGSSSTNYTAGAANNLIKSNGTNVYWATLAATDIPTLSITDKTSGTLTVARGGTGNTTGTATYATTTADTSNALYPVGVTSSATTTLKRDTSITMTGGTVSATKYLATHAAGGQDEFRVVYGSTIDMAFMVGTANENHGIYDHKANKWILLAGAANTWSFDGTAAKATADASGNTITTTYAKLASPTFTGTPKSVTPSSNSDGTMIATKAYVDNAFAANDAMIFKGTIAGGNTGDYGALTTAANRGDTYKVSTAGKINGVTVEVGDLIICTTDSTAAATADNYSTIAANWTVVQNNVDGAVFKGANAFTDGDILLADGTNGKIKDSGIKFDGSTTTKWLTQKGTWSTPTAEQVGAVTKLSSSTDNAIVRFDGTSGAIQNSGVIIDDNQNINSVNILQTGRYFHNVATFSTSGTPKEILIKTKIPFANGNSMPKIIIHMDNYSPGLPTEIGIVFYIYSNAFSSTGVTSNTKHRPKITLCTYTESDQKYVAIGMGLADVAADNYPDAYFVHFNVDFLDIWPSVTRTAHALGWEIISNNTTTSIIPTDDRQNPSYVDQAQTAISATTATNLAAKPSLATSGTTQITVTAGGKTSDAYTVPYATSAGTGSTVTLTAHTNTTNGNKYYYMPFFTATSGNLSPHVHSAVYLYETVTNGAISNYDFCFGASAIKGSITLWDGTSNWGNIRTAELTSNRTYDLPDASGTIALTTSNITGTAMNVTGTVAVANGGTGVTSIANIQAGKDGDGNTISSTYLKLSGGTLTGGVTFVGNQSSAWNDKGIIFTNGSRIGESIGLGIYSAGEIFLRPSASTGPNNYGIKIDTSGVFPGTNNSYTLGSSSLKWSNVYATTFTGDLTGTASNLANFKVTTTTNSNIESTTNTVGYVSGLTKANWNFQQTDGAIYAQFYSTYWKHQIFGDYRTGQISVRGKNNGTWQDWRRILDETNAAIILGLGSAAYTDTTAYATSGHDHDSTYLKKSGGQMTGPLTWANSTALPEQTSLSYFLGIDAFANGGKTYWISAANLRTSISAAASNHTHTTTLTAGGTATVTLSANTAYTLTAGDTSVVFKTPADSDTKNTAGSTNSTSQLYLIGATTQAANPTTNSYQYTYVKDSGLLSSVKLGLNASGTEKAHMEWNNDDQTIDFVFA